MFFSTHYAGTDLGIRFRDGEPWKKVFGPVFIYLNSVTTEDDPVSLWADAKEEVKLYVIHCNLLLLQVKYVVYASDW